MVFLALSTFSAGRGIKGQCPDCIGEGYIKIIDPKTGKCEGCWPCPECQEGAGSSVQCGSTVPKGTDIHCVSCTMGINFSNSLSIEKCKPCGVCSGKHKHVSAECTPSSDVQCECDNGFYQNKTTHECQSCDSCCFTDADDDIIEKCQKDAEIKEDEQSMFSPSTVIATSSSLFKSIKIHTAITPFIQGLTSISVPSKTQPIQSSSTSVSSANQKHDVVPTESVIIMPVHKTVHEHGESMRWIKGIAYILGVFIFIILCCFLIYLFKKVRKNRQSRSVQVVEFSPLNQSEEDSPDTRRKINGHCTHGTDGSRRNSNTVYCNKDHEVVTGDQFENMAEKDSVQKGIPSSLDDKPSNSTDEVANMQGENHRAGCNLIPPLQPVKDNLGYSTYITDVPPPIIGEMCRLLDIERVTDENDYRMLGYELGLKSSEITSIKQKSNNPSRVLLMEKFASKPNSGTLNHLISLLTKLERHDVIQVIDEWVQNQTLPTN